MPKGKEKLSGKKIADGFKKFGLINSDSKNKGKQLSDAGEKQIGFGRERGKRLATGNAEIAFEDIDRAFGKGTVTVEIVPMSCAARNAGVKAKVFMRVNIRAFVGFVGAGIVANTNGIGRTFDSGGFMTDIFEPR